MTAQDNLSVLLTANLIPSHPNITQIKDVLESLDLLGLDKNTKIVIAHDEIHPNVKEVIHKAEKRYSEYFINLKKYIDEKCIYKNVVITKLSEWGHLTRSVANGLKYITTEYVLVIQQDLPFCATIPIYSLVDTLQKHPEIKHLKFNLQDNLPVGWDGGAKGYKKEEFLKAFKEYDFNGHKICKTLSWSDQNHLTTKKYYEEVVLVDCEVHTRTTFMEGVLDSKNPDNPDRYGTYIYGEYGKPATIANRDGANTYYQDFIFDLEYCALKYPEFRLFNQNPKILKEMFVDCYGYIDCMRPDFSLAVYQQETGLTFTCERAAYRHWLKRGKKEGYRFSEDKDTVLKVILKTKDEPFLLERWLQYHINLVGAHNIIVIDNNSERAEVDEIYAKYDVLIFKDGRAPDTYHNSRDYLNFYENFVFSNAAFHIFLDTDEFLCFYDYDVEGFSNGKLSKFLLSNINKHTLTTSWLYNNYYGKDYTDIINVTDYSLDIKGHDVVKGKSVFRHNSKNSNKGHNSAARDAAFCPELFVLHLNKVNIEERIKSKIRFVKSENPTWTDAEFFESNSAIKAKWRHSNREIAEYYEDKEKYLKNISSPENRPYLYTDVISATIDRRECKSYLRGESTLFNLVYNGFSEAVLKQVLRINNIKNLLNSSEFKKGTTIEELGESIRQGLRRYSTSTTTLEDVPELKLILKTKNEGKLLDAWLAYHAALVGWENLVVIDNCSDDPETLQVYAKYLDKPFLLFTTAANPNALHDIKVNLPFYDLIRTSARHVCFLDTDEFINFYDIFNSKFDFSVFVNILKTHKLKFPLGGTWVFNSPDTQQLQQNDIGSLQTFKIDEYALFRNIEYGKPVVSVFEPFFNRTEKAGTVLCHNKDVPNTQLFPGLIIFHLDKFDIRRRMFNNLNLIKKRKNDLHTDNSNIKQISDEDIQTLIYVLENSTQLTEECVNRLHNIEYHKLQELVSYLESPKKYLEKTACYDSSNVLITNLIQRTIEPWRETNDKVVINNTVCSELNRSVSFFVQYALTPWMTVDEKELFKKYLQRGASYYEFGIGGSTIWADRTSGLDTVTGLEADFFWRYIVKCQVSDKTKIEEIEYSSDKWSSPTNNKEKDIWESYSKRITQTEQKYDLILIDGRFRTACGIQSYTKLTDDGFVLIHDYSEDLRPSYKILNQIYEMVEKVDSLMVFKKKHNVIVEVLDQLWDEYKHVSE